MAVLGFLAAIPAARGGQYQTVYSTGFELSEGFNPLARLVGQGGWLGTSEVGNGLDTSGFPGMGQRAYIGYFPPAGEYYLQVWHAAQAHPLSSGMPVVTFSAMMAVFKSYGGNTNDDFFYWTFYNTRGNPLFSLAFYNSDGGMYYALDGTNTEHHTGFTFQPGVPFQMKVTMNFAQNSWKAEVNGTALPIGARMITTTNAVLDLSEIDIAWIFADPEHPGNNSMAFDNFTVITSDPKPGMQLLSTGPGGARVRLQGSPELKYVIEAASAVNGSWVPIATNTPSLATPYFDAQDVAPGSSPRFFRGRWIY